ncbi:MAG: CHASE3 domain-containing protein [Deltaproteobacteria bacterium]|nr:CHASE3 domain-containing protein [Deltaproteobacteria bacterium]MBI4794741.1 CHASE3 domain-containing protein [Deltaproteobacteria bacterium]
MGIDSRSNPGKRKNPSESWWPAIGKILVAVWISLAVAIFTTVYLFTYQEKLRLDLDRVAHIRETLSLVYDLENQLADAESGARGFILTGDEEQLERYRKAVKGIDRVFAELHQLTVDEAGPRKLLDELKPLIEKRQALFQRSIDLVQQTGVEEKERKAVAREGARLQDRIRKSLEKLEDKENKLLAPEWAREKKKTKIILWVLTGGAFGSFSLLFLLIYRLNQEIGVRKSAESQVAAYQENLRSLASSLSLAEERERRRLAVYLHDQIGHTLALVNIKLGELQKSLPSRCPEFPTGELEKTGNLLEQAIRDTRSLTFKISSPILYELGLEAALEWLTEQVQKDHGISARFVSDGQPKPLDDDVRVLLFQAINELLVNVVKHAQAQNVEVSLRREGENLKVEVGDDGVGFQMPQGEPHRRERCGFGLFSIRERLRPWGGTLQVQSEPGAGTHVILTVPLADAAAADKSHEN